MHIRQVVQQFAHFLRVVHRPLALDSRLAHSEHESLFGKVECRIDDSCLAGDEQEIELVAVLGKDAAERRGVRDVKRTHGEAFVLHVHCDGHAV